jgi:hypothetical protein
MELSKEQQEVIERSRGITICGGIPCGHMHTIGIEQVGLGVFCLEGTLQDTFNNLDKPYVNVGTGRHLCEGLHVNTMKHTFNKKEWDVLNKKLAAYVFEEDENISCKDSVSGVKCLKVKKGSHFKPFYQNSRW